MVNLIIVLIFLVSTVLFLLHLAIKSGLGQKFGKFDMPEESSRQFILKLFPDAKIPPHLFPTLIIRLRELGFNKNITIEEVKVELREILTDSLA